MAARDITPLLADYEGVVALDARIEIDPEAVERPGPNPDLAIRPYPAQWARDIELAGHAYHFRPIRPADVTLYPDFLARTSPEDIRLRFLGARKDFPDRMLVRLTQLDYDREMAFVALDGDSGALCGIARLASDPDREAAEYGLMVRTDLQGQGLGWALLRHLVDYAKADGLQRIDGLILRENVQMLKMCQEFGFTLAPEQSGTGLVWASLDLARFSLP